MHSDELKRCKDFILSAAAVRFSCAEFYTGAWNMQLARGIVALDIRAWRYIFNTREFPGPDARVALPILQAML